MSGPLKLIFIIAMGFVVLTGSQKEGFGPLVHYSYGSTVERLEKPQVSSASRAVMRQFAQLEVQHHHKSYRQEALEVIARRVTNGARKKKTCFAPASMTRPVSTRYRLPTGYAPRDLVKANDYSIPLTKPPNWYEMKIRLTRDEATRMPANLQNLLERCRTITDETSFLRSGYRPYDVQLKLYNRSKSGQVAQPGTSEHQSGLAVDIDAGKKRRFMKATDKTYTCFSKIAHQFGFILSYPPGNRYLKGRVIFEPWHWRFVGSKAATLYFNDVRDGKRRRNTPLEFLSEFDNGIRCPNE